MQKKVVIGLGTGRCGTTSLSTFLSAQPDTSVIHEGNVRKNRYDRVIHEAEIESEQGDRHLFRWNGSSKEVLLYLENLSQYFEARRFGDVGYYFLPHAEAILEEWPEARFVVLKRERSATVDSFLRKTKGRNHWMDHDGSRWELDSAFDPTFPTLEASSKRDAIKRYWDLYYEYVDHLSNLYPDSFTLHNLCELNTWEGRENILSFLGYEAEEMVLEGNYHENSTSRNNSPLAWMSRSFYQLITTLSDSASR